MPVHAVVTKFGPVRIAVHECSDGWLATLVGRHAVPWVPVVETCSGTTEQEALAQLLSAIDRLES